MLRCRLLSRAYLKSYGPLGGGRVERVTRFERTLRTALASGVFAEVSGLPPVVQPNYALLDEPRYVRVWSAWVQLRSGRRHRDALFRWRRRLAAESAWLVAASALSRFGEPAYRSDARVFDTPRHGGMLDRSAAWIGRRLPGGAVLELAPPGSPRPTLPPTLRSASRTAAAFASCTLSPPLRTRGPRASAPCAGVRSAGSTPVAPWSRCCSPPTPSERPMRWKSASPPGSTCERRHAHARSALGAPWRRARPARGDGVVAFAGKNLPLPLHSCRVYPASPSGSTSSGPRTDVAPVRRGRDGDCRSPRRRPLPARPRVGRPRRRLDDIGAEPLGRRRRNAEPVPAARMSSSSPRRGRQRLVLPEACDACARRGVARRRGPLGAGGLAGGEHHRQRLAGRARQRDSPMPGPATAATFSVALVGPAVDPAWRTSSSRSPRAPGGASFPSRSGRAMAPASACRQHQKPRSPIDRALSADSPSCRAAASATCRRLSTGRAGGRFRACSAPPPPSPAATGCLALITETLRKLKSIACRSAVHTAPAVPHPLADLVGPRQAA